MDLIKNISEKAKESVPKGVLAPELWIEHYNKIFARLVVQECLDILNEHIREDSKEERDIYLKSFRQDLKQHFGLGRNQDNE